MIIKVGLSAQTAPATLGEWATALRPGSPCFCCDERLRAVQVPSDWLRPLDRGLRCPRCGAEVGGRGAAEAGLALPDTGPHELVAA